MRTDSKTFVEGACFFCFKDKQKKIKKSFLSSKTELRTPTRPKSSLIFTLFQTPLSSQVNFNLIRSYIKQIKNRNQYYQEETAYRQRKNDKNDIAFWDFVRSICRSRLSIKQLSYVLTSLQHWLRHSETQIICIKSTLCCHVLIPMKGQ